MGVMAKASILVLQVALSWVQPVTSLQPLLQHSRIRPWPHSPTARSLLQTQVTNDGAAGEGMSAKATQFYTMMNRAGGYSDVVLESLEDPRFRSLLRGVRDATATTEVVDAFRVLYEDYLPVSSAVRVFPLQGSTAFASLQDDSNSCVAQEWRLMCALSRWSGGNSRSSSRGHVCSRTNQDGFHIILFSMNALFLCFSCVRFARLET